jgi:cytochrome P450
MDRVAEADDVPVLDFYTDLSLVEKPWFYLERLRDAGPVAWLPDRKVVAVTGYDEALKVYNDTKTFSSINAVTGPLPPLPFEPESDDIHTCAGAPLARAEVRISIECLLARVKNIRLAEDKHGAAESRQFRYEPSYVLRGLEELHLDFDQRG